MSWNHAKSLIAACAIASTAFAVGNETAFAVGNESNLSVRGYVLSGEMLLFPAAEQSLPQGWAVVPEGSLTQGASTLALHGLCEVTTRGADLFSLFSQPMATGLGQVLIQHGDAKTALGDVSLAFMEGSWSVLSTGDALSGRPVFEMLEGSRSINVQNENEFVLHGELVLSSTAMAELGLADQAPQTVGSITLLASAYFDAAKPVAERAASVVAVGPDVIVSTIGGVFKDGTVGAITAFSADTVSCNIGDANAIWIDCSSGSNCNQHPVIGTQIYRLKPVNGANQFEQIGMSWLKHGFCAADAPNCGTPYTPHASCDWLGLFATDTYGAGLNGQQSNLGPRSEIQAFTGVYPYPYILAAGQTGNAVYKRTQVANNDIDTTMNAGAQYYSEVVYITTDESTTNGVRNNNYSTKKLLASAGLNLSATGSTIQLVPAVQHWATVEPGVTVQHVDVSTTDGRFTLGYKTTALGGGQYHYEFMLLNQNSDRSGQAFEVPLSPGASCTSVGFSDPEYHSGEPYSNVDWTPTVTANSNVRWAGETYAQNVNANALRWSTAYSFRFDSNGVPTPGFVTLTLFKAGTPTTIQIPADVPGQACSIFTYCTPSLTTHGCSPAISGTGTPSATATSGFTMNCTNVKGQQSGLFFYGTTQTAVAWALGSTSVRCVSAPVSRLSLQNSGGTVNQCNGSFSIDWNAWASSHPGAIGYPFSAGQSFYAQSWFRDAAAITGTNLSGGLGFTLCP